MAVGHGDLGKFRDLAEGDDERQRTPLLGDPEADIGAAGEQGGVRIRVEDLGEFVQRARRQVAGLRSAERQRRGVAGPQPRLGGGRVARHGIVGDSETALPGGVDDRAVAGAAAQIAGQRLDGFACAPALLV